MVSQEFHGKCQLNYLLPSPKLDILQFHILAEKGVK
jgi:hypothetical protein